MKGNIVFIFFSWLSELISEVFWAKNKAVFSGKRVSVCRLFFHVIMRVCEKKKKIIFFAIPEKREYDRIVSKSNDVVRS